MIRLPMLRGMKIGDTVVFPSKRPNVDMRITESLKSAGYGKFKQRGVLILDKNNLTVEAGVLIECLVPVPVLKKRGRPRKPKPLSFREYIQTEYGTLWRPTAPMNSRNILYMHERDSGGHSVKKEGQTLLKFIREKRKEYNKRIKERH